LSTTGSAIGFTGHVNDPQTDLVYMQQRYYDPIAGRFLSVDPVVTDARSGNSFNRYTYAHNSPYRYIDPDGRDSAPAPIPVAIIPGPATIIRLRRGF
jgi:RHS repeat-associated protein